MEEEGSPNRTGGGVWPNQKKLLVAFVKVPCRMIGDPEAISQGVFWVVGD